MGGIGAARGRYVIMGDADDSYDFGEIPRFVAKLREGYELVQGCRLPERRRNGRARRDARPPPLVGQPDVLGDGAAVVPRADPRHPLRHARVHARPVPSASDQRCTGMEFASEMIIKATFNGARIAEVPITLHPDGRTAHPPHLQDVPRRLAAPPLHPALQPALAVPHSGLAADPRSASSAMGSRSRTCRSATSSSTCTRFSFGSLAMLCGYQAILFAIFAKIFAISEGLLPDDTRIARLGKYVQLEHGVAGGAITFLAGMILIAVAFKEWSAVGFGALDYSHTMRLVIPGVTLAAIGFQTILSSFFMSVLAIKRS